MNNFLIYSKCISRQHLYAHLNEINHMRNDVVGGDTFKVTANEISSFERQKLVS